jgi:hypothetical protein
LPERNTTGNIGWPLKRRCLLLSPEYFDHGIPTPSKISPVGMFFLLGLVSFPRGQDGTFTFTIASEPVTAGSSVSVWLNALNTSSNEVSWTFPQKIERKIISPQGTFDGSMELRSAESNEVTIVPGAFVRREYLSTVPDSVTGRVVIEFPGLNANRVVLDVEAPAPVAIAPEKETDSVFARFIKEVEPEEPDKGFDPGRFFKEHISGYEPFYFIAGTKSPNGKIQISFAYQLLNNKGWLATNVPALKGFHIAYTQSSLWDWNAPSVHFSTRATNRNFSIRGNAS